MAEEAVRKDAGKEKNPHDDVRSLQPGTRCITVRLDDKETSATPLVNPLQLSSTYVLDCTDSADNPDDMEYNNAYGFTYGRLRNNTREAAEAVICNLEGGAGTLLFSSGMAAMTTALLTFLQPGDHLVVAKRVYSGSHHFISDYIETKMKVEVTFVNTENGVGEIRRNMKPNTKVLLTDSPANPLISVVDFKEFAEAKGDGQGIITIVDSTFASPYLQQPIKYGIDIVMQSCTKYMGGHSDLIAGSLTVRTLKLWRTLKLQQIDLGNALCPFDSMLLHRGLKTLHVRMDRHCDNAMRLAKFLEKHPKVTTVNYPGLPSHPDHAMAKKQMKAFGGMISFNVAGGVRGAKTLLQNLCLIRLAVSLGGVETLIEHPASLTHGPMYMSDEARAEAAITSTLIRLSIGLEAAEDLEADLEQALDKIVTLEP